MAVSDLMGDCAFHEPLLFNRCLKDTCILLWCTHSLGQRSERGAGVIAALKFANTPASRPILQAIFSETCH